MAGGWLGRIRRLGPPRQPFDAIERWVAELPMVQEWKTHTDIPGIGAFPLPSLWEHCPWLTPTVLSLARAAYSGDWESLGPLSDALEEAGCTNEAILRHLRGYVPWQAEPGGWGWQGSSSPHVRGCWALDLILGKE